MSWLESVTVHTVSSGTVSWALSSWTILLETLQDPAYLYPILAWAITFSSLMIILLALGFGPAGIAAGSLAASFQAWMYGGFTPAAGIFATLTSLAMLGLAVPAAAAVAVIVATIVALIVWQLGIGT